MSTFDLTTKVLVNSNSLVQHSEKKRLILQYLCGYFPCRYEDIKICAREYSSEAFNIVPGTEYVLPQHLEDIYRWIHPRDPRPDCWNPEVTPQVRDLLDAMRHYRHHDDNIFTVQFSSNNLVADITPPPVDDQASPLLKKSQHS